MEKIKMHQFRDPAKGCFLPKPQVAKQTAEGTHIVAPAGWDGERVIRYEWSRDYFPRRPQPGPSSVSTRSVRLDAQQRGGGPRWTNLAPVCGTCNQRKGTKSVLGFLGSLQLRPHFLEVSEAMRNWGAV